MEENRNDLAWDYGDEYAFGEDTEFTIPTIDHNIRPKTNQNLNEETHSACTIIGSWNQIIRLFGLDLDNKEQDKIGVEIVNYCTQFGYKIGQGWSSPDAINAVRKWWNEIGAKRFGKENIATFRLSRGDQRIQEALKKGHLVGFTYRLNWNTDRYAGLVYKDSYPQGTGHRTNIKAPKFVNATSGLKLKEGEANEGVHDNYYIFTNEYYIKDINKYVNKGVYAGFYIVVPVSCLKSSVEEEKNKIQRLKAINATIGVLSSTWLDLNSEEQLMSSSLATALRNTPGSREKIDDQAKKSYQAVIDLLSYAWKFAGEEEQRKYSELANFLRNKHNLK